MTGTSKMADPIKLHISIKVYDLSPTVVLKGGNANSGRPDLTGPENSNSKIFRQNYKKKLPVSRKISASFASYRQ